jgi:putative transposase
MGRLPALVSRRTISDMSGTTQHRRRVKHYHEPGDLHELTFSCYQRMPLLTNDSWRQLLSVAVEQANTKRDFGLVAFVFMPEHVHLLLYPRTPECDIEGLLQAIKRPYSHRVKRILQANGAPLLAKLTVPDKRKGSVFRYWQKGPGYDRNLSSHEAVMASIDYIHTNPVARKLCTRPTDWRWSSARWYASEGQHHDAALPSIHGLPAEFF